MQDDMQCNAALYPRKTLNAYWRKNLENIRAAWLGLGRVVVDGIGNNFMKEKPVWVFFSNFNGRSIAKMTFAALICCKNLVHQDCDEIFEVASFG